MLQDSVRGLFIYGKTIFYDMRAMFFYDMRAMLLPFDLQDAALIF